MDYSFKEVKTGRAYQDVLLSLGWTKPRKNEATFQKAMPGGLIFEANFLYAYSDHYEGGYAGMPVFRIVAPQWEKEARKLSLPKRSRIIAYFGPEHDRFDTFIGAHLWMPYLLPNGMGPAVGSFQRFNAVIDQFIADFSVEDLLKISIEEIHSNRQYMAMAGVLGLFASQGVTNAVVDFYHRVNEVMHDEPSFGNGVVWFLGPVNLSGFQ